MNAEDAEGEEETEGEAGEGGKESRVLSHESRRKGRKTEEGVTQSTRGPEKGRRRERRMVEF